MSNPLSPLAMLATSMQAQPGVYALLLGSGVSTGAGVPTGWGVVTELVRRVAAVEDPASIEDATRDPEKWWHDHHGEPPGYSSLLEALAPVTRVSAHHWPDAPSLGDITTIDWCEVEPVDSSPEGSPANHSRP